MKIIKKIKLLFISLFLLPIVVNAETYRYGNTFSLSGITIYEPGDVINFSSEICNFYTGDIDTTIIKDECNSTYTVEKKSIYAGTKYNYTATNGLNHSQHIFLAPIDDNTIFYNMDDLVIDKIFKSGNVIEFVNSINAFNFLYYDKNEELIDSIITYYSHNRAYVPLPRVEGKDVYWQMKGFQNIGYAGNVPVFQLVDYQKPTFSIQCDTDSIRSDETTTCKIIANTFHPIYELHFDLTNENIDISNVKILNNIESIDGEKEYNLRINESYANSNQTIELLSFTIKGKKDETYVDNIAMSNISYTDSVISDNYDNVENSINVVSKETKESIVEKITNPKTGNIFTLYVMIPIVLTTIAYTVLNLRKKKKNI